MQGPFSPGTYSQIKPSTEWERCLIRGFRYRVEKSFKDFDGAVHPVGEEWFFVGSNFLPYDDGLSVFVATDDGSEWHIRLCWRSEDQAEICENFTDYVKVVESPRRPDLYRTPPYPKCGTPLRTAIAKQCLYCGANWKNSSLT